MQFSLSYRQPKKKKKAKNQSRVNGIIFNSRELLSSQHDAQLKIRTKETVANQKKKMYKLGKNNLLFFFIIKSMDFLDEHISFFSVIFTSVRSNQIEILCIYAAVESFFFFLLACHQPSWSCWIHYRERYSCYVTHINRQCYFLRIKINCLHFTRKSLNHIFDKIIVDSNKKKTEAPLFRCKTLKRNGKFKDICSQNKYFIKKNVNTKPV